MTEKDFDGVALRASLRTSDIREARDIIEEMAKSENPIEQAIAQETLDELDRLEEEALGHLKQTPGALLAAVDIAELVDDV